MSASVIPIESIDRVREVIHTQRPQRNTLKTIAAFTIEVGYNNLPQAVELRVARGSKLWDPTRPDPVKA